MAALSAEKTEGKPLYIVTEPSALAERVVSKERLNDQTIRLETGQEVEVVALEKQLRALGFQEVDYVYEPGQFAVRGSILDVYSYSSEYPFRIDFFGDEIDTLRTFEVETQLSLQKRKQVEIVPELAQADHEQLTSFLHLLPEKTLIVTKDLHYVADRIGKIFDEGFSKSAQTEQMEGKSEVEQEAIRQQMLAETKLIGRGKFLTDALGFRRIETATSPTHTAEAVITCETTPQPLFHKTLTCCCRRFATTLRAASGSSSWPIAKSRTTVCGRSLPPKSLRAVAPLWHSRPWTARSTRVSTTRPWAWPSIPTTRSSIVSINTRSDRTRRSRERWR